MRIVPQIRRQLPRGVALDDAAAARVRRSTGSCSGSGSPPSCSASGSGRWPGSASPSATPAQALVIGAAFGIGRAIPVLAVAPAVDTPLGIRCVELMAERPGALPDLPARGRAHPRPRRRGAGHRAPRRRREPRWERARIPRRPARRWRSSDPIAAGSCGSGGQTYDLPGRDPAVGGPYVAVISGGDQIQILNRYNREHDRLGPRASRPGARDLAGLARLPDGRRAAGIRSGRGGCGIPPIPGRRGASPPCRGRSQIGHPSLDGGRLLYAVSKRRGNSIKRYSLSSGRGRRCSGREPPSS